VYKCAAKEDIDSALSMFFLGSMAGFVVVNSLADMVGRLLVIKCAWAGSLFSMLLLLLSKNAKDLGSGLFLLGFFIIPVSLVYYNFMIEN
jgi:hypothetical protein